jgi:TolB-like protein/Tfp pilus assembly protein PilF
MPAYDVLKFMTSSFDRDKIREGGGGVSGNVQGLVRVWAGRWAPRLYNPEIRMPLVLGTRLGRYEIVSALGAGGMGEVYRARDTALDRTVAVKVVATLDPSRPERLERFHREARAISRLSHPHICTLFDYGEQDGQPYLVMEYLEGQTLAERLEEGPLPLPDVLRHGRDIAEALDAAHRQGVVHRDLKPANVMLTASGVKLLDFGLARVTAEASGPPSTDTVTRTGVVMGTLPYMSPEQLEGREADARADVFALGVLLYEMATGRRPFEGGSDAARIAAVVTGEPPPLGQVRPDAPPALERIVGRCLAKDPDRRWQSARDIALELETAAAGGPGSLRPRARAWAAVAVAALTLAAVGALLAHRQRPAAAVSPPPGVRTLAVLPFENLGAPEDEYVADGLTDELRGRLAALPGVLVIASTSSNEYKKTSKKTAQIAAELGVGYLLVGKIRSDKRPDGIRRIRVSPELIEVATTSTRWQQSFEGVLEDVFEVQAAIAGQVAHALDVALAQKDRDRLARRPTSNLAAYDAYLKGNEAAGDLGASIEMREALGHYERAVALDPSFALAWAHLARAAAYDYTQHRPTAPGAERVRTAAERAMALAPDLPEAHLALWAYHGGILGDWRRAAQDVGTAQRKAPHDAVLLVEGSFALLATGRWEEALRSLREAERIDPRSLLAARRLTTVLLWLRRHDEALQAAERSLALAPATIELLQNKAKVYLARGDLAGARAVLAAAPPQVDPTALAAYMAIYWDLYWVLDDEQQRLLMRLTPRPFGDDRLAWAIALTETAELRGDAPAALRFAEEARAAAQAQLREAPRDAQRHVVLGLALAYLGRGEEAIRSGEKGVALQPIARHAYNGAYFEYLLARIYGRARQPEKALDRLEHLLRIPFYVTPAWLRIDPEWRSLRGHPRFQKLVAE